MADRSLTLFVRRRWLFCVGLAVGAGVLQSTPELFDDEGLGSIALRALLFILETPLQIFALAAVRPCRRAPAQPDEGARRLSARLDRRRTATGWSNVAHIKELERDGDTRVWVGDGMAPDGRGVLVPVARDRAQQLRDMLLAGAQGLRRGT